MVKKLKTECHLITGINGLSGNFLANYILNKEKDAYVVGVDLDYGLETKKNWLERERIFYYQGDLTKFEVWKNVFKKHQPDYVYHLAGLIIASSFKKYLDVNYKSTINLFKAAKNYPQQPRILLIGSAAEYGVNNKNPITEKSLLEPNNDYGLSKKKQSDFFLTVKDRSAVNLVRPFNLIGPSTPKKLLIGNILEQIKTQKSKNPIVKIFNPDNVRDFLDIREAVKFYYLLNKKSVITGEVFNLCSGHAVSICEFCQKLKKRAKKNGWQIEFKNEFDSSKITKIYGSCKKAKKMLNWQPKLSLTDSLDFILNVELKYVEKN
ncbi:MAG TPA: GDP-mannose 4,6-dehydratase [bacterium]|nr:GDP-mannose 4,6-dehydratase [bacterium]